MMLSLGKANTLLFVVLVVVMAITLANGAKPLKESKAAAPAPLLTRMKDKTKETVAPVADKHLQHRNPKPKPKVHLHFQNPNQKLIRKRFLLLPSTLLVC